MKSVRSRIRPVITTVSEIHATSAIIAVWTVPMDTVETKGE